MVEVAIVNARIILGVFVLGLFVGTNLGVLAMCILATRKDKQ